MLRTQFRRRLALVAVLALLIAGPVFALVMSTPGGFFPVAGPVAGGPGPYIMPVTISPILYGDVIIGVETGRDDRSPYAAIVVNFRTTPLNGTYLAPPPQNPLMAAITPYIPVIPNFPNVAPYPLIGPPPNPPPTFNMRFTYRTINDPANPGWGPGPASPGQIEESMRTCVAVATEFAAFRAASQTGVPNLIVPATPTVVRAPQLYLEMDPNPGTSQCEFYKFQVIR